MLHFVSPFDYIQQAPRRSSSVFIPRRRQYDEDAYFCANPFEHSQYEEQRYRRAEALRRQREREAALIEAERQRQQAIYEAQRRAQAQAEAEELAKLEYLARLKQQQEEEQKRREAAIASQKKKEAEKQRLLLQQQQLEKQRKARSNEIPVYVKRKPSTHSVSSITKKPVQQQQQQQTPRRRRVVYPPHHPASILDQFFGFHHFEPEESESEQENEQKPQQSQPEEQLKTLAEDKMEVDSENEQEESPRRSVPVVESTKSFEENLSSMETTPEFLETEEENKENSKPEERTVEPKPVEAPAPVQQPEETNEEKVAKIQETLSAIESKLDYVIESYNRISRTSSKLLSTTPDVSSSNDDTEDIEFALQSLKSRLQIVQRNQVTFEKLYEELDELTGNPVLADNEDFRKVKHRLTKLAVSHADKNETLVYDLKDKVNELQEFLKKQQSKNASSVSSPSSSSAATPSSSSSPSVTPSKQHTAEEKGKRKVRRRKVFIEDVPDESFSE